MAAVAEASIATYPSQTTCVLGALIRLDVETRPRIVRTSCLFRSQMSCEARPVLA